MYLTELFLILVNHFNIYWWDVQHTSFPSSSTVINTPTVLHVTSIRQT